MKYTIPCLLLLIVLMGSLVAQDTPESLIRQINAARHLRAKIQENPHRPVYHFVVPEGLARPFDPNGAIFWNGKYHLGFLYQKYPGEGERKHVWGHAVSTDLFHWTLYPDMLEVHEGDPENGIFSGGAFLNKEGIPHVVYKAQGEGANLIAYSEDADLKVWNKLKENPVLKTPQKGEPLFGKYSVGDADGWYRNGFYYLLSGGSTADLFRSNDRINWQYRGKFIDQDNRMRFDFEDISCADFFKISEEQDKYMLLFMSHQLGMQYYIGDYKNERFEITSHGRMNWPGGTLIAPEQLKDNKGRNIFWGWVKDPRHQVRNDKDRRQIAAAWSGTMSLPRVVSLSGNGTLQIHPPEEVKALRIEEHSHKNLTLQREEKKLFSDISGKALEIKVRFEDPKSNSFGLTVLSSPDGREETIIRYNRQTQELVVDFTNASIDKDIESDRLATPVYWFNQDEIPEKYHGYTTEQRAPFKLKEGEDLELDIFIDHSIIEVFANNRICLTQRVFPMLPHSTHVNLFNKDESQSIHVKEINAWTMAEANFY